MAVNLVGGAALGPAFDMLYKAVRDAAQKVVTFKTSLDHLKRTLFQIKPIFKDIEELNRILDRPRVETEMFIDELIRGEKLVLKCLKIKRCNIYKRYTYAKKLDDLKESLLWFFQVSVQADVCRDGKRTLVGVEEIVRKLRNNNLIVTSSGFSGCCNVPELNDDILVGLDVPVEEVKEMLLKEDGQVVVISAPGGCGKTSLVIRVCSDKDIRGHYGDKIFFVIVSKSATLRDIVQIIFTSKGFKVPQFRSDEDAKFQLNNFLRSQCPGPILIVLDDVWSESLIEDIIFPIPEYKILVTSRFILRRFSLTYKLKLLNDEDAMTLFSHSAFNGQTCYVRDDLVSKMVRSCGGYPLALKVVGRSLCGEPELAWLQSIQKLHETIFSDSKDLLDRLKSSIDVLDERLKECYMDLALFPEDQRIPATALQDMWVELYNLNEDGVDTVDYLLQLSARNLVNLTLARDGAADIIDNCSEHFVTQHDLLRELAIFMGSLEPMNERNRLIVDINGNELPKYRSKQQPITSRILSISTDETSSSLLHDIQLSAVEILILNFRAKTYSFPDFTGGRNRLKVLIITNYGLCAAKLNTSFLGHVRELKRIRLEYISFPSFYESMPEMRDLRKISLVTCEIGRAFENHTLKMSKLWPNLVEINIDYCHDMVKLPAELCDLVRLRKLCITYCQELSALPEQISNLAELEVLRLHSCTRMQKLPASIGNLHKLAILDISDCVQIDHLPGSMGELCLLEVINMRGCSGIYDLPQEVLNLPQLELVICDEEMAYLWGSYRSNLKFNVTKADVNLRWLHNSSGYV